MNPDTNPPPASETSRTDKILKDLQVNLPGQDLPLILRLIIFFTLIGGLSIFGSLFADIVRPNTEDLSFYLLRVLVGIGATATAYALIEKKRWGIWLYGVIAFFALFSNPFIAVLPLAVIAYLYTHRSLLAPSYPDFILARVIEKIQSIFGQPPPNL